MILVALLFLVLFLFAPYGIYVLRYRGMTNEEKIGFIERLLGGLALSVLWLIVGWCARGCE